MLKCSISEINNLFSAISGLRTLYLPVEKAGQALYGAWTPQARLCLDKLNTVKSPKDLFFPQSEDLVRFQREGKKISIEMPDAIDEKFVLFGVRACDAKGLQILDTVFLSDPVDTYYAARRENGIVICAACSEPEETCFCNVFGIDATEPAGDIVTWTVGDTLYWEAKTEKGAEFTEKVKGVLEEASAEEEASVAAQNESVKEIIKQLPFADLNLEGFDGDHLLEKFNSPKWAELSKACLGCGTCTFVCPTCQCYDIRDYDTGHGIQRFRCWDSCMYSDFTKMAGGNPRKTQLERFRQRFMHKLVYFPSNNDGEYSCVGCGRCVAKCPISMNIVKVARALGEESK